MIALVQTYLFLALYLIVFVLSVVALVDVLRRPAQAFVRAGKRTKNVWLALVGVGTVVSFIALPPPLGTGRLGFLALLAAVAAIVYLVDVKPAVAPYSGRRGGGPQRGGW